MTMRLLATSGSPLEPKIGFSRGVRVGPHISIAGTAPILESGGTATPGDVYGQTKRCFEIIEKALLDLDASLQSVTRTRVMLTDITSWSDAARAHGEYFGSIRPACTFVEISRFINLDWLVEVEVDAIAL